MTTSGWARPACAGLCWRRWSALIWWLQPNGRTWDHPHLLGEIRHGDPGASEPIRFGASPAPATLHAARVLFDPAFHF